MASLPLAAWPGETLKVEQSYARAIASAAPARLSALEWSIVAMAERDTLASLRKPGRLASALGSLFRIAHGKDASGGRLETLRRVAVHAWRNHWYVPTSELEAFLDAGFSMAQYELIQASIHKSRKTARPRRQAK